MTFSTLLLNGCAVVRVSAIDAAVIEEGPSLCITLKSGATLQVPYSKGDPIKADWEMLRKALLENAQACCG